MVTCKCCVCGDEFQLTEKQAKVYPLYLYCNDCYLDGGM